VTSATPRPPLPHRVTIVGGGFAGLYAARNLGIDPEVRLTMVDRRNFHLFQPLLYQVATGALSPGDIAQPLRSVLRRQRNTTVILGQAVGLDPDRREVLIADGGPIEYDTLIVATGAHHSYFDQPHWATVAPGLKTIEDATEIRRRILIAFEAAEREADPDRRREWMTFVVVLPPYPPDRSRSAQRQLERLGVEVRTGTRVVHIDDRSARVTTPDNETLEIPARTVLWAAGVQASAFARVVAKAVGGETDRAGRVIVGPDLTIPGHPEIFVVGDAAVQPWKDGRPVPGVAQGAIQSGTYAAKVIRRRVLGRPYPPFHYRDKGDVAIIGRLAGVTNIGWLGPFGRQSGFLAWALWLGIHIAFLIGFANRLVVLIRWAWSFLTHGRGTRLITGVELLPPIEEPEPPVEAPMDEGDSPAVHVGPTS
jgi:NADH dehydrogenase